MPKHNIDFSSTEMKRIKANLAIGIAKIESGGEKNPYKALTDWKRYPKDHKNAGKIIEPRERVSSATGKYQFTKQWWDDRDFNIKDFIDNADGLFGDTTNLTTEQGMELFRNNSSLQDAFFDKYSEAVLIPEALKMMDKNPLNLAVDEMAGQFHFQSPKVAREAISSGKLTSETDTNVSGYKYVQIQRDAVKAAGLIPVTSTNIINAKQETASKADEQVNLTPIEKNVLKNNEKIIADFEKKEQTIKDLNLPNPEVLRKKLYQDIANAGNTDVINDFIEKREKENEVKNKQDVIDYNELKGLIEKIEYNFNEDKDGKKAPKEYANFRPLSAGDSKQMAKLREKYDFFKNKTRKGTNKYGKDINQNNSINVKKLLEIFKEKHKGLTGEDLDISINNTSPTDKQKKDGTNIFYYQPSFNPQTGLEPSNSIKVNLKDLKASTQQTLPIDKIQFPEESIEQKEEKVIDEQKADKEATKTDKDKEKDAINPNEGLASEYYKNLSGLNSLSDDQFNYEPGKKELNIDAIVGMSLGLLGNAQADKYKIPLRTEDVSEAMKNYTAELMNKSKEGLPVQVEAAMKNQLADAYQAGLANIVNASAGNRATVLGNLGSLEQAKNKGLVNIQVEDYEAKDRAFAQYGKAIEYINDFDTRRDVANFGIKYKEAYRKKLQGEKFATTGFAKMMDALKYQKENGPGSANDMYRSLFMQKIFGFDPKMKDDGTGKIGTKSSYDIRKAENTANLGIETGLNERYEKLNPNSKLAYDNLMAQTKDQKVRGNFINYLEKNPNEDLSKVSMDNLDLALKDGNFGLLGKNRKNAIAGTTEKITNMKSIGLQGFDTGIGADDLTLPKINTEGLLNPETDIQEPDNSVENIFNKIGPLI